MPREPFVSYKQVTDHTGLSRRFVEKLVAAGTLPSYTIGGRRLFRLTEVEAEILRGKHGRTTRGRPAGSPQMAASA